jgi:L-2-hydroxyglutarate oxidase LhgO
MVADFLVVGAGVIGIAIARELRRRHGGRVLVIDKESQPGRHASGRNSGVLHAGVYYKPGTLKARLCVEGNRRWRAYCQAKKLPINAHGKVIVARREDELPVLRELHARTQANGVRADLVDGRVLSGIEPCAKTVGQALYVRDTAVVNPQRVMEALVEDAVREGVTLELDRAWQPGGERGTALTSRGAIAYGHLVNCAGLFADRMAHACGVGLAYRVLPFRGHYYYLRPQSRVRVRGNIYPVPDLRNPFLGVHFTTRPDGVVTVGPSALPLLGREQYEGLAGATVRDGLAMAHYLLRLFGKNRDHFRSIAWKELTKLTRAGFYREASGLAVGLDPGDLLPGRQAGIRAQLVDMRTAELVNDFIVEAGPRSTHVLNAVSPAFTSALPFAEHVVDNMKPGD